MSYKYVNWTITQLKNELKSRGARCVGSKATLMQRLEDYDKNDNFTFSSQMLLEDCNNNDDCINWSAENTFKSVKTSSAIPNIDIVFINEYFLQVYKDNAGITEYEAVHRKGYGMMETEFLLALIECQLDNNYYYKGQVHSEYTKNLTYFSRVVLENSGQILQTSCECEAGKGVKVVCKHVAVVCYAILKFKDTCTWPLKKSVTQKQQKWHLPKITKIVTSPKRVEQLKFTVPLHNTYKKITGLLCYDPRPKYGIKVPDFNDRVRNMVINYNNKEETRLGINGIFPVANILGLTNDHDYLKVPLHHQFVINRITVTQNEAAKIERMTRNQSKSKIWSEERRLRVTASNVGEICHFTDRRDKEKYAEKLIASQIVHSKSLSWGKAKESIAIKQYEFLTTNHVTRSGLFILQEYPFIGASPDGLIAIATVLEVKCPYSIRDCKISPDNYGHIELIGNSFFLKKSSNYFYQVQTQMLVTNRQFCDFFIWTNCDTMLLSVLRDEYLIQNEIIPRIKQFYYTHMIPMIVKKYYTG